MGLRPGQASCGACHFRPRDQGGKGNCPLKTSLYPSYSKPEGRVHGCTLFRESDYLTKEQLEFKQEETLF